MLSYEVPIFTVDPVHCDIVYTYTVKDSLGVDLAACSTCFDPLTRIFTFHNDLDLTISGADFTDYTVEVIGTAGTSDA